MRFLIIIFLLISFNSHAGDSLKCKTPKFFVDLSYGLGRFAARDGSSFLSNGGPSIKYNSSSSINSPRLDVGYSLLRKNCKIRKGVVHYLIINLQAQYFNWQVSNQLPSTNNFSMANPIATDYDKNSLDYSISMMNCGIGLQAGALYPKGFFIWNSIGVGSLFFFNKRTYNFSEHIYGPYIDETNYYSEKNYTKGLYLVSYQLNIGCRMKYFAPFFAIETNFFSKQGSSSFVVGRIGLKLML